MTTFRTRGRVCSALRTGSSATRTSCSLWPDQDTGTTPTWLVLIRIRNSFIAKSVFTSKEFVFFVLFFVCSFSSLPFYADTLSSSFSLLVSPPPLILFLSSLLVLLSSPLFCSVYWILSKWVWLMNLSRLVLSWSLATLASALTNPVLRWLFGPSWLLRSSCQTTCGRWPARPGIFCRTRLS